ncbi:MAG TPA: CcoQ/FixQ family Cbb3-type cytochrome c oxidase assembly chaperone [Steroidobacteraceae bacterium]|jgi:cytochrome c oxidase cbb3-type subunit 4|nr:CcoQ/FixQ family Cbb3-type cytochrome c oxidase assembly chaperone [Steroidobacteraceae bacterium]
MSEFHMTMGVFRGIVTGVLLVLFLWLIAWAWSRKRTEAFDAAARAPLEDAEEGP